MRAFLRDLASRSTSITYHSLAQAMNLAPPNTIHQVTQALERLMREDAAAGRPFIAALVVGKRRQGLPGPGFFECAAALERFAGDAAGEEAAAFHARERAAAVAYWGNPVGRSR